MIDQRSKTWRGSGGPRHRESSALRGPGRIRDFVTYANSTAD